jgi:DNA mismatch endonuclease (patch repair protein)
MTDCFDAEKRSDIMSRIKGTDTAVEMTVRRLLHRLGYRFRLHVSSLPGKPDIVLPRFKRVVCVHGCYWHGHSRCSRATIPKSNTEFWTRKIEGNIARDRRNARQLRALGWGVLVVWQCQAKNQIALTKRLQRFLGRERS